MAKQHIVPITNGKGNKELANGNYNVTASIHGYDNSTIDPNTQEITEGVDNYSFTIAATGTLTLHVSDNGTDIGIPIVGATFYRCDSEGTQYGDPVVSDDEGNAIFNYLPFSEEETFPIIYFKQTETDGEHTFDDSLQNVEMDAQTKTIEIQNPDAAAREFTITDQNYSGLPVTDGELTLEQESV